MAENPPKTLRDKRVEAGAKGGKATLQSFGPEWFRSISSMRKRKAGGRRRDAATDGT